MIKNKRNLPKAFAYMKVAENVGSMLMTFTTGAIKDKTHSFYPVCALFSFISLLSVVFSYSYFQAK